jgi:peptide-methionine (S)-S-oxide reductase
MANWAAGIRAEGSSERRSPMTAKTVVLALAGLTIVALGAVFVNGWTTKAQGTPTVLEPAEPPPGMAKATFASGCFWCSEAIFQQLKGVKSVVSGYSGGTAKNPNYDEICTGATGHAEAIQVTYDASVISYPELLEVFWKTHDPTTKDRQGADIGTQYRSVIFYHNEEQKNLAEEYKKKLDASGAFESPIVTQIVPFTEFYRAEEHHQNYYASNSQRAYCVFVIGPKLDKLKEVFRDKLKVNPEPH